MRALAVQVSLLGDDEVTQKVMNHFFCLPVSVQYQSHETYQMFNRVLTAVSDESIIITIMMDPPHSGY